MSSHPQRRPVENFDLREPEDLKDWRSSINVEIANAVIQGFCKNVVFFQDPASSHPHEADIRLFEQAILTGTKVRLASNAASARILLEAIEPSTRTAEAGH